MEIFIDGQTARLVGRLDTPSSPQAQQDLAPLIEAKEGDVVLDCKDLEYISSSGLRIFLMLRKSAAARGSKVVVKSISEDIRKVFMMTGFLSLFDVK